MAAWVRSGVERLARRDADALALAGREAPVAVVRAERGAVVRDDEARLAAEAAALEEGAVVVAAEEARLLAVGARGDGEPGTRGLGPGLGLRLGAERELDPLEEARREAGEHVATGPSSGSAARASSSRPSRSTMRA